MIKASLPRLFIKQATTTHFNPTQHNIWTKSRTILHQAQVTERGPAPKYASLPFLSPPGDDEVRIKVKYAGLHRVVRSRVSGSHYSSDALPHVPGIDGIGTTEDGRTVYFFSFAVGSLSEEVSFPTSGAFELPTGLDPVLAAGMVNPATSSWMGFKARTSRRKPGISVLILGATSESGGLAAPFAKELGAGRIKDQDRPLSGDVDVVIDYFYGPLTLHLFNPLKSSRPVDYVHIAALSAVMDINMSGATLRSKDIAIRGSEPGAWTMSSIGSPLLDMLEALKQVPKRPIKVVKLSDVEDEWQRKPAKRVVFAP